jgi:ATP-dependent DNA helicase RecG
MKVDQLGKVQPDTRNPVIATALEVLKITENRYSGIPTIRRTMSEYNLPEPIFTDERGSFCVTFSKQNLSPSVGVEDISLVSTGRNEEDFLKFLKTPRSRKEIAEYWGVGTIPYAMTVYVNPLIEKGLVIMTIPEKPHSRNQKFVRKSRTISAN